MVFIGLGLLLLAGVVGFAFRDRLTGSPDDLRVGDCIADPGTEALVRTVQHRPCADPHHGQVFFVGDHPDAPEYPGEDALMDWALDACELAFETFADPDALPEAELDVGVFYPVDDGWRSGDREITCWVYRLDGLDLTESLRATGADPSPKSAAIPPPVGQRRAAARRR